MIVEWNKLDINLCNANSFLIFINSLLKIGTPLENSIYNIHDLMGVKYFRLGLSRLNNHKFRHNFQDCLDPLCPSSLEFESIIHYFLHCQIIQDPLRYCKKDSQYKCIKS